MNDHLNAGIGRRDLLRVLVLGASAATTAACVPFAAADGAADPHPDKPRYRVTGVKRDAKEPAVIALFGIAPVELELVDSSKPGWRRV